jgi:hypothetical protein
MTESSALLTPKEIAAAKRIRLNKEELKVLIIEYLNNIISFLDVHTNGQSFNIKTKAIERIPSWFRKQVAKFAT